MAAAPKKIPTSTKAGPKADMVAPERLVVMRPLVFNRPANAAPDPKLVRQREQAQASTQALADAFSACSEDNSSGIDATAIGKALKNGANVNAAVNELGQTPLHIAVSEGNHSLAAQLLRAGANTRARDHEGLTPLFRALREGDEAMSGMLARAEEKPEAQVLKGRHAIHDAASQGYAEAAEALIARGLSPTIRDVDEDSPLMEALKHEKTDAIFALAYAGGLQQGMLKKYIAAFESAGGYELDGYDIKAFLKAALAAPPQSLKPQPLAFPAIIGVREQDLFISIANRDGDAAAVTLKKRPDLNARNAAGDTPLIASLRRGAMRIADMVAAKSDVKATGAFGQTPLHHAATCNDRDGRTMTRTLLDLGANVNAQDARGQTPLMLAAQRGFVDNAETLLESKARLDIKDNLGLTALDHARFSRDNALIELLETATARKAKASFKAAAKAPAKTPESKPVAKKPVAKKPAAKKLLAKQPGSRYRY